MEIKLKRIDLQYLGFLNTPLLWETSNVCGLKQLQLPKTNSSGFDGVVNSKLRLGKLVEQFVFNTLENYNEIELLIKNIQIQQGKLTLGELDCILTYNGEPIHLEIVYKFYLYDASVGTTELEHWIGPNRKDSFIQKLTKLKEKQLPLLYSKACEAVLGKLKLNHREIKQYVFFKAQLFVPLELKNESFKNINNDCIKGVYINYNQLNQFSNCKFYIPTKINWLIDVHTQVNWLTFKEFLPKIKLILDNKTAPLCWIKSPNGELQKCFLIWW
ncbi:DUF1853 family protein [Ichthyenterobacterium magnum]|nr:DUF1853 family protein [Ichthyenterobacterium magnum]